MAPGPTYKFDGDVNIVVGDTWYPIGSSIYAAPGTWLIAAAYIKEQGTGSGTAVMRVDPDYCRTTKSIAQNGKEWVNCSFQMPSSNATINVKACSLEGGVDWIHDTKSSWYLRPTTTPTPPPTPTPSPGLLYTTPTYQILKDVPTPTPEPIVLLYTTPVYQISKEIPTPTPEPIVLLYTTPVYQIEKTTEAAELLYTTPIYQIEKEAEAAELLYTTPIYQIEKEAEAAELLYTTPVYQIEKTTEEGFLFATTKFTIESITLQKCLLPRLKQNKMLPRIQDKNPAPRVFCTMEYIRLRGESYIPTIP